ncbi:endonuclease or glycosyl hydrolase [Senna tora]|uniref:Endonuclease or glycosyl hydrolase n=1 Tax=Senna tora TaxID=362788 RepID=A0A834XFC6_9FABA|nr:endonuclease or glycosyl hydrolase [Senna tora]
MDHLSVFSLSLLIASPADITSRDLLSLKPREVIAMSRILFLKNLFIFSASFASSSSSSSSSSFRRLLQVSHFATSSSYPLSGRRHEEESRNVPVSVWWDFENCNLPVDVNIYRIAHCITEAVRAKGIKGPIQITAFGDVFQLTRAKQEALSSTGITLTHIPNGGKNSADRSLLVDLMYWVSQNPPPAHLFLISGDRDFAGILHRLRMNNYNILLASPEDRSPSVLCSAATIMWHWNTLLKGKDLSGKHFNHPPDGPFASWYGHHKVPLEDPFPIDEQSTCLQTEDNSELRPPPKAITRHIRHVLYSYPKGISLSELRVELSKADIHLDKDYYGHRKFSRFLLSVANIKFWIGPDKQLFVAPQKIPESYCRGLVATTSSVDNEELNFVATSKLSGEGESVVKDAAGTPLMASSNDFGVEDVPEKAQQVEDVVNAQVTENRLPAMENEEILSSSDVVMEKNGIRNESFIKLKAEDECVKPTRKEADAQVTENQLPAKENEILSSSDVVMEKNGIRNESFIKLKAEDEYVKPTRKEADAGCHSPYSSPVGESVIDKQIGGSTETCGNKSDKRLSFFGWIRSWWPFWRSDENSNHLIAQQNKMISNTGESELLKLNLTVNHSEEPREMKQSASHSEEPRDMKQSASHSEEPRDMKQSASHSEEPIDMKQTASHSEEPELSNLKQMVSPADEPELSETKQTMNRSGEAELFSSSSFWTDMESFITTRKGSILVCQSRSRKDMMQHFRKFGPIILKSLSEDDLLQLVDLLISEKKWLEEKPSETFPFRLVAPDGKSSGGLSHGANGLRSIFLSRTKQGNLQKSSEGDLNKKCQSISHTGVSSPATNGKEHTERSRTDILADTKKLVSEILKAHSEGFNICTIPKLFLDRYGYPLDFRKLGYPKLASLLQTLPGVKIESGRIIPTDHAIWASNPETTLLNTQEINSSDAVFYSDSELSDSYPKDDSKDSPWEELGPVSVVNYNQRDLESKVRAKAVEMETSVHPDYEPSLSDDGSSESEEDSSSFTQPNKEGKTKYDGDDSSLLETLESWYNNQEGEDSPKSDNAKITGVTDDVNPSSMQSTSRTRSKNLAGAYREKQKPPKSYSFVADSNGKDPLVDGILHTLRKSKDLKMQN